MKKLVLMLCALLAALTLASCGPDSVSCYGTGGAETGTVAAGAENGGTDPAAESSTAPIEIDGIRPGETDTHTEKGVQFYGTVTERGAGYLLVAPDEGRVRLTAGPDGKFDEVELFRVEVGGEFDISKYRTGDRVAVTYSGERTEMQPPEIRAMDIFPLDEAIAEGTDGDPAGYSPARFVYVKGKLYYDTGLVPEQGPTCGTMDGYLTEIPENETPDADGEANFPLSEEQGWQLWSGNAVVTQVDGEWHIFESGELFPLCSLPTAEPKMRAGED